MNSVIRLGPLIRAFFKQLNLDQLDVAAISDRASPAYAIAEVYPQRINAVGDRPFMSGRLYLLILLDY